MTTGVRVPQGLMPGLEKIVKFYPQGDTNCQLYLPLYDHDLRGAEAIVSKDQNLHVCTVTGALWTPLGRTFDGDDKIDIGNPDALMNLTAKSVLVWYKVPVQAATKYLIYDGYLTTPFGSFYRTANQTSDWITYFKNSAGDTISLSLPFTADTWEMQGYSWDGTTITFIKNGEYYYKSAFSGTLACTGEANTFGKALTGVIGEIQEYNRGISVPAETKQIYNATKWRYQ